MSLAIDEAGWMPRPRWAVSALFLANGYVVGNWAPKIPEMKARLDIGEGVLGLLILVFGLGSLALMPVVGGVVTNLHECLQHTEVTGPVVAFNQNQIAPRRGRDLRQPHPA